MLNFTTLEKSGGFIAQTAAGRAFFMTQLAYKSIILQPFTLFSLNGEVWQSVIIKYMSTSFV